MTSDITDDEPPFVQLSEEQWNALSEDHRRACLLKLFNWIYDRVYQAQQTLLTHNRRIRRVAAFALAQQVAVAALAFSVVAVNTMDPYLDLGILEGHTIVFSTLVTLLLALVANLRRTLPITDSGSSNARFSTRLTSVINHLNAWWQLHVESADVAYQAYLNAALIVTHALRQLDHVQKLASEIEAAQFDSAARDLPSQPEAR